MLDTYTPDDKVSAGKTFTAVMGVKKNNNNNNAGNKKKKKKIRGSRRDTNVIILYFTPRRRRRTFALLSRRFLRAIGRSFGCCRCRCFVCYTATEFHSALESLTPYTCII